MSAPEPAAAGGGLEALLAGRVPAGAYRWPGSPKASEVRGTVERAGWRYAHLDGERVGSKAELLDALGVALSLRGLHGRNLDALEECLRSLPGPTVLLWDGWGSLARAEPHTFTAVTTLLSAPAAPRPGRDPRPATWVLLRGTGPDGLGVPDLPGLPD